MSILIKIYCYDLLNNDDDFLNCVKEVEDIFYSFLSDYYNLNREEIQSFISLDMYAYFADLEACNDNEIKVLIEKFPLLTVISKTNNPDYLQLILYEELIEKASKTKLSYIFFKIYYFIREKFEHKIA